MRERLKTSAIGVLLAGALRLPKSTLVEMVFEMPEQVYGRRTAPFSARAVFSASRKSAVRNLSHWPQQFSTTNSFGTTEKPE